MPKIRQPIDSRSLLSVAGEGGRAGALRLCPAPPPARRLIARASAAWALARAAGDANPNWAVMCQARNEIERFKTDPYPTVRRLASGVAGDHWPGGLAA